MSFRAQDLDGHLGRLLVLLRHFAPPAGSPLHGLTKLAKLDFLLRYPAFTDQLVRARALAWPDAADPTPDEQTAVEARMIRYKYGPWDDRYYPLVGALVGLDLAELPEPGQHFKIRLTERGRSVSESLSARPEWQRVDARAAFLAEHFDLTGNRLKEMIYTELPDVVDRAHRSVI